MDEWSGSSQDSGAAGQDGGLSLTSPSLTGLGGLHSSEMGSSGLNDLRSVLHWLRGNAVKHGGDKRLGVEGRGNSVIDWGNGEPGVSNTEAESISNVLNSLELTVGVNIRVSTGDTSVGVAHLLLHGVDVGVAVVQVSELVLGVELTSSVVRSVRSSSVGVARVGVGNLATGSRKQS